jgi:ABC-type Fe3+ transport system substrate-binding protein
VIPSVTARRTAVAAVLLLHVTACGGTGGGTPTNNTRVKVTPELQKVLDGAKAEGNKLVLVSSIFTRPSEVPALKKAFNAYYGGDFDLQLTQGGQFPQLAAQAVQEYQAGKPSFTDVLTVTETHIGATLLPAGDIGPSDWSWAPEINGHSDYLAAGGAGVSVVTRLNGITYNTDRVKGADVPKSLNDLLDPKYKDKYRVATTSYGANFPYLASPDIWGKDKTTAYMQSFVKNIKGTINCGNEDRVASGEFDIFSFDCGTFGAGIYARNNHAPVTSVVPSDAALLAYWYLSIPKNAVHPNMAKLFVNFMVSRAGQDFEYQYEGGDLHLAPGSRSKAEYDKYVKQGVQFHVTDVAFTQAPQNKGLDQYGFQVLQPMIRKATGG